LVRRLLALCAVTVMIFAAVALGQSGAPAGAIVVTGQQYPPLPLHGLSSLHGIFAASEKWSSRGIGISAVQPPYLIYLNAGNHPNEVASPSNGLVARDGNVRPDGLIVIAGQGKTGFSGDGGAATSAEVDLSQDSLAKRSGIAVAADGTLYVADTKNSTIRAVAGPSSSEPGIIRSVAGKWGPRQNVTLVEPMGVAVDRAGNLYIADHIAGAVDMLDASSGQLETVAHVISPTSIAVTLDGSRVFVASPDTGAVFAIQKATKAIDVVPGFTPAVASTDAANSGPCAMLDSGAASSTSASISTTSTASATPRQICPAGLAVDGRGNLFVADANAGKILRVDAKTNQTTVAVTGMIAPGDIAFDSEGDLFVSEQGRNRVLALGALGDPASSITLTAPLPPACPQGAAFTFCNEPTDGTSASFGFTLTNTSASMVNGITITPAVPVVPPPQPPPPPTNFTTTSSSCTGSLGPGASCVINVAFTPLSVGAIAGTLSVTDSNQSDSATENLAGTGDDFEMQIVNGQSMEVTVVQGGTATFMAQLNAVGVFGQSGEQVTLACPANLPAFATCAFKPCPISPKVGGSVPFSIVIVTSTQAVQAPPVPNPCNTPASGVTPSPQGAPPVMRVLTERLERLPHLPALLAIFAATALGLAGIRALPAFRRTPVGVVFAMAMVCGAVLLGCGKKNTTGSTATPVGTTTMNVVASATDSSGNPLNASRGLQIILDVIK
jgi:sugar lactone lactonase YvrE